MDISKVIKYGMVTIVVTSAGIYVLKKVMDNHKTKYKKAKSSWDQVGQDIVVLHLPLRPKSAGTYSKDSLCYSMPAAFSANSFRLFFSILKVLYFLQAVYHLL